MNNRFARHASKWPYYSYLSKYNPRFLRRYTTQRYYELGRRGAWDNLVYRSACNHVSAQEDITMNYKIPVLITKLIYRVAWQILVIRFCFVIPAIILMGCLTDLSTVFNLGQINSLTFPNSNGEQLTRYESLYMYQYIPKY